MAKTLNEMVYDVKNIGAGGFQSDDNPISDRQVAYWVNDTRAMLASQMLSANKSIPDALIQHLECIELECMDAAECCEISSSSKVLRSTQKIPRTIQRNNRNTILSISSPDQLVSFSETTYFRQRTNRFNRYTGNKPRWFVKNDYLYVINEKVLQYVSLSGIFEDPTEAILFLTCDGEPCFTWDTDYPVTSVMARLITDIILKDRLGIVINATNDEANDQRGQSTTQVSNEQD